MSVLILKVFAFSLVFTDITHMNTVHLDTMRSKPAPPFIFLLDIRNLGFEKARKRECSGHFFYS